MHCTISHFFTIRIRTRIIRIRIRIMIITINIKTVESTDLKCFEKEFSTFFFVKEKTFSTYVFPPKNHK